MAKPTAPEVGEVDVKGVLDEAQKTGNLSEAKFMALLSIMMAKEARLAEKETALEIQIKQKDEQRKHESQNYTATKIYTQTNCKHLKGGAGRTRGQQKDPSVYLHTYTDGVVSIKCQLCKAKWTPKDTKEYLFRSGVNIVNWTKIGWQEALEMCDDSSNKPSSSERFAGNNPTGNVALPTAVKLPDNLQI